MTNGYRPFWENESQGGEFDPIERSEYRITLERYIDDFDRAMADLHDGAGADDPYVACEPDDHEAQRNAETYAAAARAAAGMSRPAFDGAVERTLHDALDVCRDRGDQYGDTWSLDYQITTFTDHVLRAVLGHDELSAEAKRLLKCAALIDIKDERMLGPWKADSVDDGINYRAAFRQWMDTYDADLAG